MEFITTILLLILMVLPIVYLVVPTSNKRRIAKYMEKLPGPPKYPFIGSTKDLIGLDRKDLCEVLNKRNQTYGPIYRNWTGSLPTVHILKAEYFEQILSSSTLIRKSQIYNSVRPWLGQGLLTSGGSKWHKDRKLITPAFHFKILENFLQVMNEKAALLVDSLEPKADGETTFDMFDSITHCALDIICETAMGVQMNALTNTNSEYVKATYQITELTLNRIIRPWLASDFVYYRTDDGKKYLKCLSILHGFADKVIADRKLSPPAKQVLSEDDAGLGKRRRLAFLDLLLETSMTDREIREQVDTFMFAGHDTTTTATAWVLMLLGNHPEIQERVREEINSVFHEDKLTLQDLSELKYLEMVIKEGLRLFPSAPVIGRMLTQDITIDKYFIPAGITVIMHIQDVHKDPDYFSDPETFDPERFLPENCAKRHPYSYVPFSAGARNCIGQKFAMCEEKTLLAWILKNYRVRGTENYKTVKMFKEVILKPQNGLQIVLERI